MRQLPLFPNDRSVTDTHPFPSTRYQGSKRKMINWLSQNIKELSFDTALDVFGGTGVVSHWLKQMGKQVTYNDLLAFNHNIGLALIENDTHQLTPDEVELILTRHEDTVYPDFIQAHFHDIYFTDEENAWLDYVIYNIQHRLKNPYKKAIARFALFQACIIKRPYNLFHRANLYLRTAQVERSFGNKTTWDTPFEAHFRQFVTEANQAIFTNGHSHQALQLDALATPTGFDLVYIDPPYLNAKGIGVDYRDFYHFLEGMMHYDQWHKHIESKSKHRRLKPQKNIWNDAQSFASAFEALIARHRESILVISYRDDGTPSIPELVAILRQYKADVKQATLANQYVLSHKKSQEVLLIAT